MDSSPVDTIELTGTREEGEPLYTARYSKFKVIGSLLIIMPLPLTLLIGTTAVTFRDGRYASYLGFLLGSLSLIVVCADSLLFKKLEFYADQVTKTWYLFGKRTIPYSSAKVVGPPVGFKWLSSAYQIRETGANGKTLFPQVPILYFSFFMPHRTSKGVAEILDFLTDDKDGNPRVFRRACLQVPSVATEKQKKWNENENSTSNAHSNHDIPV